MNSWTAIQYVTSGLSLVAFAIAAALWFSKYSLDYKAALLKKAKPGDIPNLISTIVGGIPSDVSNLPPSEQRDVILAQVNQQSRREMIRSSSVVIIAFLIGTVAVISILHPQPLPSPPPYHQDTNNDIPDPTNAFWVCVAHAENTPYGRHIAVFSRVFSGPDFAPNVQVAYAKSFKPSLEKDLGSGSISGIDCGVYGKNRSDAENRSNEMHKLSSQDILTIDNGWPY